MAVPDKFTPTAALAQDAFATAAGMVPTPKGVKLPRGWLPPDFGRGQDEIDPGESGGATIPPMSAQARDRWYAESQPAVPPGASAAPPPAALAPRAPSPVANWSAIAPAPRPTPSTPPPQSAPPQPVSEITSATDREVSSPAPASAPARGADYANQFQLGLSAGDAVAACGPAAAIAFAQRYGRNPSVQEAMALARQSGWTQAGGMNGVANEKRLLDALGVGSELQMAPDWQKVVQHASTGNAVILSTPGHYFVVDDARQDPNGRLLLRVGASGRALRSGSEWMTPAEIQAASGRLTGNRSDTINGVLYADHPLSDDAGGGTAYAPSDLRIASSGGAPASAGPGAPAGGAAPQFALHRAASAPPAQTQDQSGGEIPDLSNAETWFTYADHGKEVLIVEGADGQVHYIEVGSTDKPDGTVLDSGTLDSSSQPQRGVRRVGAGQDELDPGVSGGDPFSNLPTPDQTRLGQLNEELAPSPTPPAPPPPSPVADAPPVLTPQAVVSGYQRVGQQPSDAQLGRASQQFAEQQTPESRAATSQPPAPETLPFTNIEGQPIEVPNVSTPPTNPLERYQEIRTGLAKTLLPSEADATPGVTGAVAEGLDPTFWALGGADLATKTLQGTFKAGSAAMRVGSALWPQALMSAAVVQRGVEHALPEIPGAVASAARALPGATADAARNLPGALGDVGQAAAESHNAALAAARRGLPSGADRSQNVLTGRYGGQVSAAFAARLAAGAVTGGVEAALHTSPDDPNRASKITAASLATGFGFIALPTLLEPVARYANYYLAPAKNLPELAENAIADYANMRNGAMMRAYTYALEGNQLLGSDAAAVGRRSALAQKLRPKSVGANHLNLAIDYEANPDLAALAAKHNLTPEQVDFLRRTEQVVEASRQMGTSHGYISGDVRSKFGVARYFPRVYEDLLNGAKQRARSAGVSPMDFFSQEREIAHLSDPQAQALNPLNSFVEPVSWYLMHVFDSEAKHQLIENLKSLKSANVLARDGRALIENTGKGPKDFFWGGNVSQRFQAYDFHPDLARVLTNMHAPRSLGKDPVLQTAARTWATLKDAMLSTSGFHLATEMTQIFTAMPIERRPRAVGEMVGRVVQHTLVPGAHHNWMLKNLDLMVDAANDGLMIQPFHLVGEAMPSISGESGLLGGVSGEVARAVGSGVPMGVATYSRDRAQGTPQDQAILDAALWGAGAAAWGVTGAHVLRDMLWNKGVPSAKLLAYGLLRDKHGGKAAAEFANEVFGGQNLAAIGRSRSVQAALRAGTFAADWQEGWVRQMGNTFRGGPLGSLNRQYWARATVLSAFILEGLNLAFNGHLTDRNAPGNQFRLKMTGLYDHLGLKHVDDRGRNYDPYMDILGPYRSFAELGEWAAHEAGAPVPDSSSDFARYVDARLGPVPSLLVSGIQNRDWKGEPIAQPGDNAALATAKWAAYALGNYAPVGPSDIQQLTRSRESLAMAGFSALTGRRITHVTPGAEVFRQRDKIFQRVGISMDQVRRDQEMYANLVAQMTADRKKIADNPNLTMQQRLTAIDRERIPSRPTWTAAELLDKVPNETDRSEIAKQLMQFIPGVRGSTAPADLDPDIDVGAIAGRYWQAGRDLSGSQQNVQRQRELAKMANELGQDQFTLRDAIYWKARHPKGEPMPAAGVPSEEIDQWVDQWKSATAADPNDPTSLSDARWQALKQISQTTGRNEDVVWARIKTRMTPSDGELSANDAAIEAAFDALTAANPERFPKFVGPDGKPLPGDAATLKRQLAEATTHEKRSDPKIRALVAAQEQGKSARLGYLLLQSPNKDAYERVFGLGRSMTDRDWQQYTSNPSGHYVDNPSRAEAERRDLILRMYRAATPTQRRTIDVQANIGGVQRTVKLGFAYRDFHDHLLDKKWRQKIGEALPSAEEEAAQPEQ